MQTVEGEEVLFRASESSPLGTRMFSGWLLFGGRPPSGGSLGHRYDDGATACGHRRAGVFHVCNRSRYRGLSDIGLHWTMQIVPRSEIPSRRLSSIWIVGLAEENIMLVEVLRGCHNDAWVGS